MYHGLRALSSFLYYLFVFQGQTKMHLLLFPVISICLIGLSISHPLESDIHPFNYEGARKYLHARSPEIAMPMGHPGGFWGCYLQNGGGWVQMVVSFRVTEYQYQLC